MWLAALSGPGVDRAGADAGDGGLLARLTAGDTTAAAELYDRHSRIVYSLVLRIVQNESEAEDVVQDVFVQAWQQAARYDRGRGSVAGWLLTMARTRAIDRLRARRVRPEGQAVDVENVDRTLSQRPDVVGSLIAGEEATAVRRALAEAAGAPARGDRAGLFRGAQSARGCRKAGRAARHRQDSHPHRHVAAQGFADAGRHGGRRMSGTHDDSGRSRPGVRARRVGAGGATRVRGAPRRLRRLRIGGAIARARDGRTVAVSAAGDAANRAARSACCSPSEAMLARRSPSLAMQVRRPSARARRRRRRRSPARGG